MRTSLVGLHMRGGPDMLGQPPLPTGSVRASEQFERRAVEQKTEQPLTYKDEARLHDVDCSPCWFEA